MEVLKVSMDEATGLVTIVFHAEKVLEAKKFFKELFGDDEQEQPQYEQFQQHQCGTCNGMPCVCGTSGEPYYEQPPATSEEYKDPAMTGDIAGTTDDIIFNGDYTLENAADETATCDQAMDGTAADEQA